MTDLWMPGVTRKPATQDGGSMTPGAPRAVWHTTENDPASTTASSIANYLNGVGYQVHLVWNPVRGEIVQMIPADRAGRGLEHPAGTPETNRKGSVCIQIEVVGRAAQPFTDGPLKRLDEVTAWLRSLGIPDAWPAGRPLPADKAYGPNPTRSAGAWQLGGHFAHSQVPNNHHADPGAIDITRLFQEDDMTTEQAQQLAAAVADAGNAAKIASDCRNLILDPNVGVLTTLGRIQGQLAALAKSGGVDQAALDAAGEAGAKAVLAHLAEATK